MAEREEQWLDHIESLDLKKKRMHSRHAKEQRTIQDDIDEACAEAYADGVSLSAIARRLNVHRQSIYRYKEKRK